MGFDLFDLLEPEVGEVPGDFVLALLLLEVLELEVVELEVAVAVGGEAILEVVLETLEVFEVLELFLPGAMAAYGFGIFKPSDEMKWGAYLGLRVVRGG